MAELATLSGPAGFFSGIGGGRPVARFPVFSEASAEAGAGGARAASHVPVLVEEATDALMPERAGGYIDATFGGGGHSASLLKKMTSDSALLGLDCDECAESRSTEVEDPRFRFLRRNFKDMEAAAEEADMPQVRGVLFDLGASSMQLDDAERGLSFLRRGPLDMRLDRRGEMTAESILRYSTERELTRIFREYGEEPEARRLGRAIFERRREIQSTADLAGIVAAHKRSHPQGRHPATLVFQALRIAVNQEFASLRKGLEAASRVLSAGGRLAVIAFHSLEDRIVKRALSAPSFPGIGKVGGCGMRAEGGPIRASAEEVNANPRARSACLRVFVKEDS